LDFLRSETVKLLGNAQPAFHSNATAVLQGQMLQAA